MTAGETSPAELADRDQVLALAEDLTTQMVDHVRQQLDDGASMAEVLATTAEAAVGVEPARVASALAVALLRLARQDGTR